MFVRIVVVFFVVFIIWGRLRMGKGGLLGCMARKMFVLVVVGVMVFRKLIRFCWYFCGLIF